MGDNLYFAARGSNGFSLQRGTNASATPVFEDNTSPKDNPCRVFQFSNGGRYFAYCDSTKTVAIECATGKPVLTVPDLKRTQQIAFSPRDNVMLTFEPYVLYGPKVEGENRVPDPNLRVWNLFDGRLLITLIAQKQTAWQPQWTDDETLAVRLVGSELQFHRNNNFERFEMKLVVPKIGGFAISRGVAPFHIACYVAAQGGQPASVQVRRVNEKFPVVITKTFFKSDRANLYWNCKGTSLLILAAVDVDSTNQSYYGEQNVALVSTNGESCMVSLDKKGPVYAVKWHPNGREFTVCYGFMPSKVTMYNLKGESVFDMAEGPRNDVFYNRFGNILLVCGFGNLAAGKMEFWDVDKRTPIIAIEVPNTTYFEWAPDGQHFITATTTPRLRIDNVYRIWNYKGQLLHEVPYNPPNELWQVSWRPIPDGAYNKFEVAKLTAEQKNEAGLRVKSATVVHPNDRLPAGAISKAGAYVPPHLRKGSSRGALSNNTAAPTQPKVVSEAEKKQRALQKKLDEISKLKDRQAKGDALEVNQLAKIQKEAELVAELEKLKLESEAN